MTFTAPLGLLALLAVPAVVVLHLFRNRLPERRIAASFLFAAQALQAGAGRTRTRLLRTPSFWFEIAAAVLLAAWLAGLTFGGLAVRPLVVVLDDSASMAATGARDRALGVLRERLRARDGGGFVAILRTGPRPEALLDARDRGADVEVALARWRPGRPRHDPRLSLDLARELAGPDGEVWFVTDEALAKGHDDVTVLACGAAAPNAALQTVERDRRADGSDVLRLRIAAYGSLAQVRFSVQGDDAPPTAHEAVFVEGVADVTLPLPKADTVVHVRLADDALAVDNDAWLLPPRERPVAVADLLPAAQREELALDRVFGALRGWRSEPVPAEAQLLLRAMPGAVADGQLEVVFVAGAGEARAYRGPFVVDRATAWLRGVALQGVFWVAGDAVLPGQALVTCGSRVLASEEPLEHGRRVWLCVQGGAGNLVKSPDWPVWFANLLELCRPEVAGLEQSQVTVGAEARCRRPRSADENDAGLVLLAPDGSRRASATGRIASWLVDTPGVHRVLAPGDRELERLAARFHDPSESDLRGLSTFVRAGAPLAAAARREPVRDTGIEGRVLAALVLVLVLCDWWWLARRAA